MIFCFAHNVFCVDRELTDGDEDNRLAKRAVNKWKQEQCQSESEEEDADPLADSDEG